MDNEDIIQWLRLGRGLYERAPPVEGRPERPSVGYDDGVADRTEDVLEVLPVKLGFAMPFEAIDGDRSTYDVLMIRLRGRLPGHDNPLLRGGVLQPMRWWFDEVTLGSPSVSRDTGNEALVVPDPGDQLEESVLWRSRANTEAALKRELHEARTRSLESILFGHGGQVRVPVAPRVDVASQTRFDALFQRFREM